LWQFVLNISFFGDYFETETIGMVNRSFDAAADSLLNATFDCGACGLVYEVSIVSISAECKAAKACFCERI